MERKITPRIEEDSLKWLSKKINQHREGGYQARNSATQNQLSSFSRNGKMSASDRTEFLKNFQNSPFEYVLTKETDNDRITTDLLDNYYVFDGNNAPVSIGFYTEFFEDDFETREDKAAFYKERLNSDIEKFKRRYIKRIGEQSKYYDEMLENTQYNTFTKNRPVHHFTNFVFRIILPIILFLVTAFITVKSVIGYISDKVWDNFSEEKALEIVFLAVALIFMISYLRKAIRLIKMYLARSAIKKRIRKITSLQKYFDLTKDKSLLDDILIEFGAAGDRLVDLYSSGSIERISLAKIEVPNNATKLLEFVRFDSKLLLSDLNKFFIIHGKKVNFLGAKVTNWFFYFLWQVVCCGVAVLLDMNIIF